MTLGTKQFFKDEPVLYFDTLKTSSLEGTSTTVYAQGGRGNARLMSWDGEKTTTFTMEDALISAEGLMILAGAELIAAHPADGDIEEVKITQHMTQTITYVEDKFVISTDKKSMTVTAKLEDDNSTVVNTNSSNGDAIYVMLMNDGEIISEPYIATYNSGKITVGAIEATGRKDKAGAYSVTTPMDPTKFDAILVDYYVERTDKSVQQINISADSFGGSFYVEASTLFRNEDGIDIPAEFIMPNCRVQSNFTFSMASSGDPSTFTFTVDCFPDYTRWDKSKKVLAAIQLIPDTGSDEKYRATTDSNGIVDDALG